MATKRTTLQHIKAYIQMPKTKLEKNFLIANGKRIYITTYWIITTSILLKSEPFEVFGQMPGYLAFVADGAVLRHGGNGLESIHRKRSVFRSYFKLRLAL